MLASIVLIAVFIYITLLFSLARWGDRQQFVETSWVRHPFIYALALGVYCTSWTFYGLVGTASEYGWGFFPILLGPVLLFTLGFPLLERIYRVSCQEHIHSLADFLSSRYGKRQGVAATVSLVAMMATIPYIALQLKAVSDTLQFTVGGNFLASQDLTLLVAISMIVFTQLFGVRRLDVSGYHSGLMTTIAFESLIKLCVLLFIAGFAVFLMMGENSEVSYPITTLLSQQPSWLRFFIDTLLSICAIFCLPRMFHVTFVECLSPLHLRKSRLTFVSYLLLISLCVLVIAWAGNYFFLNSPQVSGDSYVIALPLSQGFPWLALIAFLGGFSAATAMIIVATVTLSQMLSNDVVLPLLVRRKHLRHPSDYPRTLIVSRRITVIMVVMAGYAYQNFFAENTALTSIGLNAFALIVQLAPGILLGLFWRKGNAKGLYVGLAAGVSIWFYTLMLPLLDDAGLVRHQLIEQGPLGIGWLKPENLFGLTFADDFSRGVILSLSANIFCYCWFSLTAIESLGDRIQAMAFTRFTKTEIDSYDDINFDDLRSLLAEFLGDKATESLFSLYEKDKNIQARRELVAQAQKVLAGSVGVASSQAMIEGLRSGKKMAVEEVVNLFGETARALRFNQETLFASFENISAGISVVDRDLCLVAWNQRYETLFNYPADFLRVGLHVADIMRFNGERGLLGEGNIEDLIRKRLSLMSTGNSYRVVRTQNDDAVIEIKGCPLPNGGYVTTYDDITEFMNAQKQLEEANIFLEKRVQERTQTIKNINENLLLEIDRRRQIEEQLRRAKQAADEANASKTTFLAQAGHDIMQPLNAANLYVSALVDSKHYDENVIHNLRQSIQNTESIISSLLEVARLDSGALTPRKTVFSLQDFMCGLMEQAIVQKPDSVELSYIPTSLYVFSDRNYLRRIVQNFLVNAIKYTANGKVLLGCRRRLIDNQLWVDICILDNGPGIAEYELSSIFGDFYRVDQLANTAPGIGLGLSVVKRFAELLEHSVQCQSVVGRGSCFSVRVPVAVSPSVNTMVSSDVYYDDQLSGLSILYVDDDPQNLLAMTTLVEHWQCHIVTTNSVAAARDYYQQHADNPPNVLLMDYQLGDKEVNGISLAQELQANWQSVNEKSIAVCIVSATADDELPHAAKSAGYGLLAKPVKPAKLRAWLIQVSHH